jgi:hypothetical protein
MTGEQKRALFQRLRQPPAQRLDAGLRAGITHRGAAEAQVFFGDFSALSKKNQLYLKIFKKVIAFCSHLRFKGFVNITDLKFNS